MKWHTGQHLKVKVLFALTVALLMYPEESSADCSEIDTLNGKQPGLYVFDPSKVDYNRLSRVGISSLPSITGNLHKFVYIGKRNDVDEGQKGAILIVKTGGRAELGVSENDSKEFVRLKRTASKAKVIRGCNPVNDKTTGRKTDKFSDEYAKHWKKDQNSIPLNIWERISELQTNNRRVYKDLFNEYQVNYRADNDRRNGQENCSLNTSDSAGIVGWFFESTSNLDQHSFIPKRSGPIGIRNVEIAKKLVRDGNVTLTTRAQAKFADGNNQETDAAKVDILSKNFSVEYVPYDVSGSKFCGAFSVSISNALSFVQINDLAARFNRRLHLGNKTWLFRK